MASRATGGPLWLANLAVMFCIWQSPEAIALVLEHDGLPFKCYCWDETGFRLSRDPSTGVLSKKLVRVSSRRRQGAEPFFLITWNPNPNLSRSHQSQNTVVLQLYYTRWNEIEVMRLSSGRAYINERQTETLLPHSKRQKLEIGDRLVMDGVSPILIKDAYINLSKMDDPIGAALWVVYAALMITAYVAPTYYFLLFAAGYFPTSPALVMAVIYSRLGSYVRLGQGFWHNLWCFTGFLYVLGFIFLREFL